MRKTLSLQLEPQASHAPTQWTSGGAVTTGAEIWLAVAPATTMELVSTAATNEAACVATVAGAMM